MYVLDGEPVGAFPTGGKMDGAHARRQLLKGEDIHRPPKKSRLRTGILASIIALLIWPEGFSELGLSQHIEHTGQDHCRDGLACALSAPGEVLRGIVLFHLDTVSLTEERIAVLAFNPATRHKRLRILKCSNGETDTVFALEEPQEPELEDWDELESFPSNGLVPGVVIWGGLEYSRSELIVVCYTGSYSYLPSGERVEKRGIFKTAFKGYEAVLADLDLDGFPEIIAEEDKPSPEVWAFVDGSYVKVGAFPLGRLHSAEVLTAIKAARKRADFRH